MGMKLTEFNEWPAVYILWQTKKPQKGDHMTIWDNPENTPNGKPVGRRIIEECLHSSSHPVDKNKTEEWWSFTEISELEFQRIRRTASRSEHISKTHDSLF
jgi:hypothetical protein